jgi:hypothetical protein
MKTFVNFVSFCFDGSGQGFHFPCELDKSGIAELTFKDRHKHSGDRADERFAPL